MGAETLRARAEHVLLGRLEVGMDARYHDFPALRPGGSVGRFGRPMGFDASALALWGALHSNSDIADMFGPQFTRMFGGVFQARCDRQYRDAMLRQVDPLGSLTLRFDQTTNHVIHASTNAMNVSAPTLPPVVLQRIREERACRKYAGVRSDEEFSDMEGKGNSDRKNLGSRASFDRAQSQTFTRTRTFSNKSNRQGYPSGSSQAEGDRRNVQLAPTPSHRVHDDEGFVVPTVRPDPHVPAVSKARARGMSIGHLIEGVGRGRGAPRPSKPPESTKSVLARLGEQVFSPRATTPPGSPPRSPLPIVLGSRRDSFQRVPSSDRGTDRRSPSLDKSVSTLRRLSMDGAQSPRSGSRDSDQQRLSRQVSSKKVF